MNSIELLPYLLSNVKVQLTPTSFFAKYKFPFPLDRHCEKIVVVAIFINFVRLFKVLRNSSYCSYQWFDMQTRRKSQFCFVLTLLPRLCAFLNKDSGLNSNNSSCLFSCSWPRNSGEWDELASDVISEITIFCFSEKYSHVNMR